MPSEVNTSAAFVVVRFLAFQYSQKIRQAALPVAKAGGSNGDQSKGVVAVVNVVVVVVSPSLGEDDRTVPKNHRKT